MEVFFWGVECLSSFVEMLVWCVFCGIFVDEKGMKTKRRKIILLSLLGSLIIILLNCLDIFSVVHSVMIILTCIVIQYSLYQRKIEFITLLVLICSVIMSAIDFATIYFVAFVSHTHAGYLLNEQSSLRITCIILSKSILIFFVASIKRLRKDSRVLPKKYVMVMSVCSVFLLASNLITIQMNTEGKTKGIGVYTSVFFIASIVIELFLYYLILKVADTFEQQQTFALVELKNQMLQNSLDDTENAFRLWRNSVHDYKNNIISLTQLAKDGKLEEIQHYLEQESKLMDQRMFCIKTGNSVVDAILNMKQRVAEQKGIDFVVNAAFLDDIKIRDMDMANILGNLIDNALEASYEEENPYIEVQVRKDKNFVFINITNKYTGEFLGNTKTRKVNSNFHGIGIKSVKEIVVRYKGEFEMIKEKDEVTVNILMVNK